jgi:hypothetical protein
MNTIGRAAEDIARRIDRRDFLSRSAAAAFSFTAAAAVVGIKAQRAWATHCDFTSGLCSCGPLNNQYCVGCSGASCPQDCHAHMGHCPAGPNYQCWCTKICCYNCSNPNASYCGHYNCCDCDCPLGVGCTCRAFTYDCRTAAGSLAPPCCA